MSIDFILKYLLKTTKNIPKMISNQMCSITMIGNNLFYQNLIFTYNIDILETIINIEIIV